MLDVDIVLHGMRIIEMKVIVPVIGVGDKYADEQYQGKRNKFYSVTHVVEILCV